jgi:predicted Zn-dependent peptidase
MAFKGTPRIGTTDYNKESSLLDAMDDVFYSSLEAGSGRERARLDERLRALEASASEIQRPNAYGALLQREGASGLNASTTHDATQYYVALPANKTELWFALEAERFASPVFRGLYSEKQVVLEERRLRVDNSPLGPFQEEFALKSLANNYRRPVIGYASDIEALGRRELEDFFKARYGPSSLTIAIAGDVNPDKAMRLAEKYFGGWRASSSAVPSAGCSGINGKEELAEALPVPAGPLQMESRARAGPAVMRAYYRPCVRSADSVSLDLASDLLTGTRSSRMQRALVQAGTALTATSFATYPGDKRSCQWVTYAIPAPGGSLEALDTAVLDQIAALAGDGPSLDELGRVKKATRVTLLSALTSNGALASALCSYRALGGDWRGLLRDLEAVEGAQPQGVRDAAARWLTPDNSFVGYLHQN